VDAFLGPIQRIRNRVFCAPVVFELLALVADIVPHHRVLFLFFFLLGVHE
jgi:hypothetical protein